MPVTAKMRSNDGSRITSRTSPPPAAARFPARTSTFGALESQNAVCVMSSAVTRRVAAETGSGFQIGAVTGAGPGAAGPRRISETSGPGW